MTRMWWKVGTIILLFYTLIAGFLLGVPDKYILNETIRNLYFHVPMWMAMLSVFVMSVFYSIRYLDKGLENRFYGGPTKWRARSGGGGAWRERDAREFIKGTEYNRILKPGEVMEMLVCTDPGNPNITPAVTAATNLQWRIQLRSGFVEEDDKYGTVTTVIGVAFKASDIKNES